ncbi:FxSxx-COOH system tetratricopeptide repeat protein [Peribacillus simplex]|uniref:FxSxx-COOH system tetratricopeptide repeat protein n=1 Tax=Peribacillus simplex TaxID=1478 RepID=UPI0028530141|nr:FxSxx-COOH system tetratricopeptide repeat protein [Peribacillus simplex]MDR4926510.1 FxSxx-COOH system tetratricopeptide repeat protein [Peribacillus simplex]
MDRIIDNIQKLYEGKKLIPFIGAGLSIPFKIPLWKGIILHLSKKVPVEYQPSIVFDINTNDYWSAISNIKKYGAFDELELQEHIQAYILENQISELPAERHNYFDLCSLNFETFITTNYDNLLYDHIKGGKHIPLNLHEWKGSSMDLLGTENHKRIWHLHGNLSNVGSIVISKEKYDELYLNEKYNAFFSMLEGSNSFLFMGFSFNDYYFSQILKKYNDIFNVSHYILLDRPTQEQVVELKEKYRLNVIQYDSTQEGHEVEIKSFLNKIGKKKSNTLKTKYIPQFSDLWNVPYKRNPFFLGRDFELDLLEKNLISQNSVSFIQAVSGLGGVGKTQLAVEFCYKKKDSYTWIWWINAENIASITASYEVLAKQLKLPNEDEKRNNIVIDVIKKWMQVNDNWLVVFDNLIEESKLETFLPPAFLGHVIVTTRKSNVSSVLNPLNIDKFTRKDSIKFLLKRTKKEQEFEETCSQLAELLGDLPLALEQAGAYIIQTGISINGYVDRFKKYRDKLTRKGKPINYDYTLATTWEISFEEIDKKNPVALDFLYLCAFLSPDEISLDLFFYENYSPKFIRDNIPTELDLDEILSLLRSFSLIKSTDLGFSIHRLVQAIMIDKLPEKKRKFFINVSLDLIMNSWRSINLNKHALISHTLVVTEHAINNKSSLVKVTQLLNILAVKLIETGEYKKSKELLEKAIKIDEEFHSEENDYLARDYNNIAISCIKLSEFEESEIWIDKCFNVTTNAHEDYIDFLNTLATLRREQGEFIESINLYKGILSRYEVNKENSGTEIFTIYNNLALSLEEVGEFGKAIELYEVIIENLKGVKNKSTISKLAQIYSNLSLILERIGDYKKAKVNILESIKIVKEHLEGNEVFLANYYNNLGFIFFKTFQHNENIGINTDNELDIAKKYINRSLRLFRKVIGENHLHYCSILNNLGMIYEKEGNFNQAKKKYTEGIKIIRLLGHDNHQLLSSIESNLGSVCWMSGEFKKGEELLFSALERDIMKYGECHLEVATDFEKLGCMYFEVQEFEKAKKYFLDAYNLFKKILGSHNPSTVLSLENLYYTYKRLGDSKEIQKKIPILIDSCKRLYGENHYKVTNFKKIHHQKTIQKNRK